MEPLAMPAKRQIVIGAAFSRGRDSEDGPCACPHSPARIVPFSTAITTHGISRSSRQAASIFPRTHSRGNTVPAIAASASVAPEAAPTPHARRIPSIMHALASHRGASTRRAPIHTKLTVAASASKPRPRAESALTLGLVALLTESLRVLGVG